MANTLFALYNKKNGFTQLRAGYFTSLFGLLNFITRPLGGYLGDLVYPKGGVPAKKWLMLFLSFGQGIIMIGLGVYIEHNRANSGRESSAFLGLVAVS